MVLTHRKQFVRLGVVGQMRYSALYRAVKTLGWQRVHSADNSKRFRALSFLRKVPENDLAIN